MTAFHLPLKIKIYWELVRPFTLLMPFVGFLSAAIVSARVAQAPFHVLYIVAGAMSAAILNAASNTLNQIFDIEIDKVNKPGRPLPKGLLAKNEAGIITVILYMASIGISCLVPNRQFFIIVLFTAFCTFLYSAPPARFKKRFLLSNLIIAFIRGPLLFAAGWSAAQKINTFEPWFIGGVFGIFLLGASVTKDFSDGVGDRRFGCKTLPVIFGIDKTIRLITPFLIFPFAFLVFGKTAGILHCNILPLALLAVLLAGWGIFIARLLRRDTQTLALESNHITWKHMYLMLMTAQAGIAVVYLL